MVEQQPRRIPELWYEDGSLIIQAENSLFRVYQGILAHRSSVFADLFSMPFFPDPQMMDGCPILHLPEDENDTRYFLCALHHSGYFAEGKPTDLDAVAGILRLSTKYNTLDLRDRAIQHLLSTYPTTLSDWDKRHTTRTIPATPNTPFAVLQLARETHLHMLLPTILYCCCTHPIADLFDGVTWQDRHIQLSPADQRLCTIAVTHLIDRKSESIYGFLRRENLEGCTRKEACNYTRFRLFTTRTVLDCAVLHDDFDWVGFRKAVCASCYKKAAGMFKRERQKAWEALPGIFGLPEWKVLIEESMAFGLGETEEDSDG